MLLGRGAHLFAYRAQPSIDEFNVNVGLFCPGEFVRRGHCRDGRSILGRLTQFGEVLSYQIVNFFFRIGMDLIHRRHSLLAMKQV